MTTLDEPPNSPLAPRITPTGRPWRYQEWMDSASCASADPDAWFPENDGGKHRATNKAIQICDTCPVRVECLTHALEHDERHGVRGGLTERQRAHLRRKGRLPNPPGPPYDEVAVAQAVAGEISGAKLRSAADRVEAVRRLHRLGWSDGAIAQRLHLHKESVMRIRHKHGMPAAPQAGRTQL